MWVKSFNLFVVMDPITHWIIHSHSLTIATIWCFHLGIPVDEKMKTMAHTFLKNIENFLSRHYWWLSKASRNSLLAFCLYVRHKLKENVANLANKLFEKNDVKDFSLEALGWLLIAMSSAPNAKNVETIMKVTPLISLFVFTLSNKTRKKHKHRHHNYCCLSMFYKLNHCLFR
jgi:hypothetical protein